MIEEVIEDFEQQLKDAVADDAEGKRKAEASWKIHRIHWEKNRFIYDLMYVRKVMSRELVSCCSDHSCGALCLDAAVAILIMPQHYETVLAGNLLMRLLFQLEVPPHFQAAAQGYTWYAADREALAESVLCFHMMLIKR